MDLSTTKKIKVDGVDGVVGGVGRFPDQEGHRIHRSTWNRTIEGSTIGDNGVDGVIDGADRFPDQEGDRIHQPSLGDRTIEE
jgi:hypothetical protein